MTIEALKRALIEVAETSDLTPKHDGPWNWTIAAGDIWSIREAGKLAGQISELQGEIEPAVALEVEMAKKK